MKYIKISSLLVITMSLAACIAIKPSTPVSQNGFERGITVVHQLPKTLPGESLPIPGIPYVFLLPDAAALMLVPVPFVGDVVQDQLHKNAAAAYKNKFTNADPYDYALKSLQKTTFYKAADGAYTLYPYVIVQQGFDDVYRASLVYHIEGANWVGRYLYHLPTTYPKAEFVNTPPSEILSLQQELAAGAEQLTDLLKRDEVGNLTSKGKATIGSLFIVSERIAGLMSPTVLAYPGTGIVEEGNDYVIARIAGDMKTDGKSGGMLFGVHYFHKNQLHTYKITTQSK